MSGLLVGTNYDRDNFAGEPGVLLLFGRCGPRRFKISKTILLKNSNELFEAFVIDHWQPKLAMSDRQFYSCFGLSFQNNDANCIWRTRCFAA